MSQVIAKGSIPRSGVKVDGVQARWFLPIRKNRGCFRGSIAVVWVGHHKLSKSGQGAWVTKKSNW